ncbi:regulatory protein zeste [Condylostylus longicornis]|uniref:regulatory protein zeste n=1 Tax=Condylostylus longicornis TaxID=2530218 RepID=UPI00244E589D|nr:regulatory protein zeste [Condylostylus longicornis]
MTTNLETNQNTTLIGLNIMEGHNAPNSSTNRFTKEEKHILFQLFLENEDIIDIKQRKSCPKKHISIRDCWNKIADEFNNHPSTTTVRSLKQIQKFWLNARLRKSYPGNNGTANSNGSNENSKRLNIVENGINANNIKTIIAHAPSGSINSSSTSINAPKLIRITPQTTKSTGPHQYENIKFEKECETEEIEMVAAEEEEEDLTQEVEISTSSNDVNMVENESQQYSIDHISAEKLTLNDLLEFKNSRPRDEIVLQIRTTDPLSSGSAITNHPKDSNNTQSFTTSYRIAHPVNQATIIQDHQFQQSQSQNQTQHVATQPVPQKIIQSPQTSTHSPNFYSSTSNQNNMCFRPYENIEDKINYYQLKEAELKYKEGQLKIERMKIELQRSKDELKNIKELHAFRIKEMEIKIKILTEEEKRLKTASKK